MPTDPEDSGGLRNTLYRKETRSKRRMTPTRRFLWRIVAAIGHSLLRMFWSSCRVVRVVGDEHMAKALADSPSVIPVYWHQHQIFCAKYLLDQAPRGLKLGFLISPSVDGEIVAMIVSRFGGHVIRGSATHTGARALRDYREALVAPRKPIVLTAHPEGCALLYPEAEWEPVRADVEKFPSFYSQASWWKRLLLGFEEHVVPDNSGRVLISPALRMHAKLEREVMMVGQGHYFELWDSGVWAAKRDSALAGTGRHPCASHRPPARCTGSRPRIKSGAGSAPG